MSETSSATPRETLPVSTTSTTDGRKASATCRASARSSSLLAVAMPRILAGGGASADRELLGGLRGDRVGEALHPEAVEQPEQARDDRHEQGDLQRVVAGRLVDAEDLVLHVRPDALQERLELRVAHHL